ncbi:cell division protein CrgA [Tessaracoccus palaemonis]|uniref:Cell division protein CrgA n=1 Tax=Tessaracoccus palaemonis TaxID=2829499 RepID=A0ABX8SGZ9_9ACTN|nr:cell division protein CrgA [Tessaracoccus palaemonis]QXT62591.1 cell division protein CrgA [Tessaracoccus palaemonis]
MPESKTRKQAVDKKKSKEKAELAEKRREAKRLAPASRNWVPAVFVPMGLLGVLWMVVYNLAGNMIPFMQSLGDWNVAIGLGLIVACFSFMTLWK